MTKEIKKTWESELIGKVRSMINHLYPGIEEELGEVYIHENEPAMKIIKRKVDFRLGFHAWFLLKHEFPSGATAMEMANSFPMDYFNKKEKKMIKNFLDYKESLFEILKISEDKKDYTIKDLSDKKVYLVKTIDLPVGFKEKDFVQAIIVKNIESNYFFYGTIMSFDILDQKKFIKEILNEFKIENKIRKERENEEIEWEIQK
ncbi:hypothetical protein HYW75_03090 [Candidatus Pacearchaeota archaeon]|nr:hypothetical protein [Candidatus Pacearchaeota archaeon]